MSKTLLTTPLYLGVNLDHVATLREVRGTRYPDPIEALYAVENGGADGITLHMREDLRHIQKRDVEQIHSLLLTRLNLEMAITENMLSFAEGLKPPHCCLVPEKREELTTEGGLEVAAQMEVVRRACQRLGDQGIDVSLFIDPDPRQVEAAVICGAPTIEIHTGAYADAKTPQKRAEELKRIQEAAILGHQAGLVVNGGHGLNYQNVQAIAAIPQMNELNIGHGLVARALFCGLEKATAEMKRLMREARL
jgi:pyridoxine 5-phosphate synthase